MKLVPATESVTRPFAGAFQVHHAVCPLETPSRYGSPVSNVAFASEPARVELAAVIGVRLAKLSLSGWAEASGEASATKTTPGSSLRKSVPLKNDLMAKPDFTFAYLHQPEAKASLFSASTGGKPASSQLRAGQRMLADRVRKTTPDYQAS